MPKEYHGHIIGREGKTLKRIKEETGTIITVPPKDGSEEIKIVGSKESVEEAKHQIQLVISDRDDEVSQF